MPNGQVASSMTVLPGGWVCLLPSLFHGRNEILDKSLLALYTGFVGRRNGDVRLASRGTELYIDALQALRQSEIWSSPKWNNDIDAQLATTLIFSRCELLLAEGGGYMAHIRGGLQILQKYASRLPKNDLTKLLVKKFRVLGVSESTSSDLNITSFYLCFGSWSVLIVSVVL